MAANMSYCRFQNTVSDLSDCEDALLHMKDGWWRKDNQDMSEDERKAAIRLIKMCHRIGEENYFVIEESRG